MTNLMHWFPIMRALTEAQRVDFAALMREVAAHPNFDLALIGDAKQRMQGALPQQTIFAVAGHLAEVFFFRRDILQALLARPRHFLMYASPAAYAADGGIAGGQFHVERGAIMMLQARLFEGFGGEWPGVCPFLHEFGHMLDFFDARTGGFSTNSHGLLPGLSAADGALYRPKAREAFVRGKQIEMDRYAALKSAPAAVRASMPYPLGHPYVFQNDTEFCAGYLEMWFRNPNAFAAANPDLYTGYVELLGWDARSAWPNDFEFYVAQNRKFYAGGEPLWESKLTVAGSQ